MGTVLPFSYWEELGEAVPLAVIATDLVGIVRVWSAGACSIYGYTLEETLGRPIQEITVGPLERSVSQQIMDQVAMGIAWEGDFHARNKCGDVVEVHVLDLPIRDVEGNLVGIVGLSFLLGTESRANPVEDLLGLSRQIRESRWRERTRSARVLHDEVAQLVAAARSEVLAFVEGGSGAEELTHRLTDYLDRALVRLRKEVAVLLESEIDVWEMILRCYELSREIQVRAGLLVDCRIVGTVERFQNLDASVAATAFSVVREAVRNAERHAAAHHVEVTVEAKHESLEVTITDDGLGMGRSHEGMGLTLLRNSVDQLKGQFEVQSIDQDGYSGTIVTARFPLKRGG